MIENTVLKSYHIIRLIISLKEFCFFFFLHDLIRLCTFYYEA